MLLRSDSPRITRMGLNVTSINAWLNLHKFAESLIGAESDEGHQYWKDFFAANTKASRDRVRKVMRMVSERDAIGLNKAVKHYRIIPLIDFGYGSGDQKIRVQIVQSPPNSKTLFPEQEAHAVASVITLAQNRQLELLKTCPVCGDLFLPTRGKQVNCSTRCSKKAYAETPKDRKRRALNAKKRYDITFGTPHHRRPTASIKAG
jgi:hypothetical protein